MQHYLNVSMRDLDCLLEERGFGTSCGIFADKSKAAFHAVVPREGAETADIMEGFWGLWSWGYLVFGTESKSTYTISILLQLEEFVEKSLLRVEISGHPEAEVASENRRQNMLGQKNNPMLIVCFLWSNLGLLKEGEILLYAWTEGYPCA